MWDGRQTIRLLARLLATVLLVAGLATIAAAMTAEVGATANRMRVNEAVRTNSTISRFFRENIATGLTTLTSDAAGSTWRLRPEDRVALDKLAESWGSRAGAVLFDGSGRRAVSAGKAAALPRTGDPGERELLRQLKRSETAMSWMLLTPGGMRVVGFAARVRANPGVALVVYIPTADISPDQLLREFAKGTSGHYYVVDAHGLVLWTDTVYPADRHLPGFSPAAAAALTSGIRRVSIAGTEMAVIVDKPPNGQGMALVFEEGAAAFFGGIEGRTHLALYVLVALIVLIAVALSWSAYRNHRGAQASADKLRGLVADVNDLVLVLEGTRVTYASPAVARILDTAESEALGHEIDELVGVDGAAILQRLIGVSAGRARPVTVGDVPCQTATGRVVWVETTVADRRATPSIGGFVVSMHDVTERREQSERLLHDATHDRLTGLANRARFAEAVNLAIRRAYRGKASFAVLFLDLDGFKPINDMFGHDAGDEVLREVARRLSGCLRSGDTPARLGGDEFVVALDPPIDDAQAEDISRRIIAAVNQPIEVPGGIAQVGVSIGIAIGHGTGVSSDAMVRDADLAMYQAKEAGKNRYHLSPPPSLETGIPSAGR